MGDRHTGCHDAAKHLEVLLAIMWWLRESQGSESYQKVMNGKKGRGAIHKGVKALQLRCQSRISEFEARSESRACAEEASAQAGVIQHGPRDLLPMQSRDPTMPVYKSGMFDKGYDILLGNWVQ